MDIIFTNETQDVENYKNNFLTLPNFEKTFNKNLEIKLIDINRNNFHISATEIRKNPYKNWFFIPNYYNTTYVKEYRKEYIKEEMQNHIENIQYSDYSNIAYEHNRRILESIKNADRLTFIDTEFSSLQTFSIIQNHKKNPVIEDFIKHSNFDIMLYIEKKSNSKDKSKYKTSEFDKILQSLLEQNNQEFIQLYYKNNNSLTENYIKSIVIINKYLEIN